jgi:hypothetical protein
VVASAAVAAVAASAAAGTVGARSGSGGFVQQGPRGGVVVGGGSVVTGPGGGTAGRGGYVYRGPNGGTAVGGAAGYRGPDGGAVGRAGYAARGPNGGVVAGGAAGARGAYGGAVGRAGVVAGRGGYRWAAGTRYTNLPGYFRRIAIGSAAYYYWNNQWYAANGDTGSTYYDPVEPPAEEYVEELPPGAVLQNINGIDYYVADGQYFLQATLDGRTVYYRVNPYAG